jgi:RNA polymerase sigma-70 factor (ECF subfamily)
MKNLTSDETGEEIYRRFLDGDDSALEKLVDLYGQNLTRFISGFVNDPVAAEELTIDAFAELALKRTRFAGRSSLKTWLFSIGKHLALNFLKKHKKERHLPLDEIWEIAVPQSPETDLFMEERRHQVHGAMRTLKVDHSEVLRLLFFEDMSYVEAGIRMNKTETQVRGLAHRAKRALKKILEHGGFIREDE